MVNIRANDQQNISGSPRGEVGEIDTRAPFQSVKAAVSLFREVAVSREKRAVRKSKLSSENVLDKEAQLLLAQREIDKYKQKLESAENTKAKALSDLERAKRTLDDLTTKLQTVSESKHSAIEAAEEVKKRAKELEITKSQKHLGNVAQQQELDLARKQYKTTAWELNSAKQELTNIRQDFDAALEAKWAAFQQGAEAQRSANVNTERVNELTKEIAAMRRSHEQLKIASAHSEEQQAKLAAEKDARIQACKISKQEAEKNLESLKKEYDPELTRELEAKLAEITAEIEFLQEEMTRAHACEMDAVTVITTELTEETKTLQNVAEEETSLRNTVAFLRLELENAKRERTELLEIESKKKSVAQEEELMLEQLASETEFARLEAEETKKKADKLKQEAENARRIADEADKKLELILTEAEEAKEAEKKAHNAMKLLSCQGHDDPNQNFNNRIKLPLEEFENLKKNLEDCQNRADSKEAEATAELEAMNERRIEAEKKLEANLKAIEEIKEATDIAVKSAETAKAAQSVVEGELRRRREKEQMPAA